MKNFREHPQRLLLSNSITPVLKQFHPDDQYCIGQEVGIYWRLTQPPEDGAIVPDWFYVPHVNADLNGQPRRSYVLWQEYMAPLLVLEFVSGDGLEERDRTPLTGKFWIYEQAIRVPFYGIYEVARSQLEVYRLVENSYVAMLPNKRGHYPIAQMGVELGIWQGRYHSMQLPWLRYMQLPWLRWWDLSGNLLLTDEEQAEQERQQAARERQRATELEALLARYRDQFGDLPEP